MTQGVEAAETVTIGVAVAIPRPYADEIEAWRGRFGDPLAAEVAAHVTLLPPTEVTLEELDGLHEHLAAAAPGLEPFEVLLRGTGTFRPVSPVVFVTLAHGIAGCETLEARIREGLNLPPGEFPYHPHVTLAHGLEEQVLDEAEEQLRDYEAAFVADAFTLYLRLSDGVWRPWRDYHLGVEDPVVLLPDEGVSN